MSLNFAGVLTVKTTNFAGHCRMSLPERRPKERTSLTPYGDLSITTRCYRGESYRKSPLTIPAGTTGTVTKPISAGPDNSGWLGNTRTV